jgi:hypothetical protein
MAAAFILSLKGGIGGTTGRSWWWGLTMISFPVGWVMALIGAIGTLGDTLRAIIKKRKRPAS